MWSIAPFIGAVAAVSKEVGWAVLPVFMSGLSPFIILVRSLFVTKKAFWKLSSFDYACGAVLDWLWFFGMLSSRILTWL